jgi:hypothetical protein
MKVNVIFIEKNAGVQEKIINAQRENQLKILLIILEYANVCFFK